MFWQRIDCQFASLPNFPSQSYHRATLGSKDSVSQAASKVSESLTSNEFERFDSTGRSLQGRLPLLFLALSIAASRRYSTD